MIVVTADMCSYWSNSST